MKVKYIVYLSILLLTQHVFAQDKYEVERKADKSEVPVKAAVWLENVYPSASKINWYKEVSENDVGYEAKLKWQGQWHSVEFDEDGALEDIEITIRFKIVPKAVRDEILTYFEGHFSKYKLRKVQRQLSGLPEQVANAIKEDKTDNVTVRYEIEFYGKAEGYYGLWEGLFDNEGRLEFKRKVVLRPTDNLTY